MVEDEDTGTCEASTSINCSAVEVTCVARDLHGSDGAGRTPLAPACDILLVYRTSAAWRRYVFVRAPA
jgi:hypothetical protein